MGVGSSTDASSGGAKQEAEAGYAGALPQDEEAIHFACRDIGFLIKKRSRQMIKLNQKRFGFIWYDQNKTKIDKRGDGREW
jgi:hypothetical protein